MKVIHVLRKPCSEGTVATNALRWGTGALNIDGSRVSCALGDEVSLHGRKATENGWDARWSNAQEPTQTAGQALGRWPANLVLQHLDGCVQEGVKCVQEGVKKVKVIGATAHQKEHRSHSWVAVGTQPHEHAGFRDPDGTETVAAWVCAPGCPVATLDKQSGNTKAVMRKPTGKPIYATEGTAMVWNPNSVTDTTERGFTDEGGASRFFKQVSGKGRSNPSDG